MRTSGVLREKEGEETMRDLYTFGPEELQELFCEKANEKCGTGYIARDICLYWDEVEGSITVIADDD
jgi:hypothetical protein